MAISGPLTLAVFAVLGVALLIVAYRTHWVDRLAHRLEGPPQRHQRGARQCSHLRVVRNGPPSPLSNRSPCDLFDWRDPEDVA